MTNLLPPAPNPAAGAQPGPLPVVLHEQQYTADNAHCTRGRGGWQPQFVVWHTTQGRDSRAWLSTSSPPGDAVSIHKLGRAEGIYSILAPADTAWHVGYAKMPDGAPFPAANYRSLGYEIEHLTGDLFTDQDYHQLAHATAAWCFSYGLPLSRILLHREIAVFPPDDPKRAGQFGRRTDPDNLDVKRALALTEAWLTFFHTLPLAAHHAYIY